MKNKITLFSAFLFASIFSYGQFTIDSTLLAMATGVDSTYLYDKNGNKEWYYIQKDVYCFKIQGSAQYTGLVQTGVAGLEYWDHTPARFNEIHFDPVSTLLQRAQQIEAIYNLSDYSISSFALTRSPFSTYDKQLYYRSDDRLMVTFNENLVGTELQDFMNTYRLNLIHEPSSALPSSVTWTYVFEMKPAKEEEQEMLSIILAQIINENEPDLVKLAEPNLYATSSLACTPTTEVGLVAGGTMGTWHIRNTGGVIWSGISGTNDADADICECWGEGYTGSGVKVGIIDFGGIEFSHPDFAGTNIPNAYNAVSGNNTTFDFMVTPNYGHGMNVTGVVGATPNNTNLGTRWAVGSAYNAEIKPYIVSSFQNGVSASNTQIVTCIQLALLDGIDVINMSFKTDAAIGNISMQIDNSVLTGRPNGDGTPFGTVFVAGAGNFDGDLSHFPANSPNVIGVGWSNPEDYRSAYSSTLGTGTSWTTAPNEGSSYGPPTYNYDVVAPGELIMTTDITTTPGAYIVNKGSSMSSPIVASIAAMMLEKDPTLNYNVVKTRIRKGAQKVHSTTYNYNMFANTPGYNNEMFYGRVSCINSLNSTASLSEENKMIDLTVMRQNENEYLIFIPQTEDQQSYELIDMAGRVIYSSTIGIGQKEILVDLSAYSKGLYIFKLANTEKAIATSKLMK